MHQGPHGPLVSNPTVSACGSHSSPSYPPANSLTQFSVFLTIQLSATPGHFMCLCCLLAHSGPALSSGQLLLLCEALAQTSLLSAFPLPPPQDSHSELTYCISLLRPRLLARLCAPGRRGRDGHTVVYSVSSLRPRGCLVILAE